MRETHGDLDRALADIVAIRMQIARDTAFRGLGSATLAATGALALVVAGAQALLLDDPTARPVVFFGLWVAAAVTACLLIGFEAVRRSRRVHSGLADAMVFNAIEGFLPAGGAGLCLGLVFARFAPDQLWMLPGLWQVLVGLGLFASARILPRSVPLAGAWYLLAGLTVLALASETRHLSPWLMGVPFAVGQGLVAIIIHRHSGPSDGSTDGSTDGSADGDADADL
ncbi:UNVERIFIED_ORG: hypothetical protein M2438_002331 [Methylobacterium sp. SuP10 SLI 274]|uniref:hypothetical protein n=1 Tax=Methylorubrum extorquens TaxID=408 RepID=UPI0020A00FF2|nr:hypothetical protein [Methylorubrum extorquens]MDF9863554.1 hypothetical protein [Methylorubrum pseudosasae]MDH6637156.1 hypothetical protein [Methylobacterium sp. SuP10 SLI 274]MDH6666333.1 hypothetical protein [Methylorubrum zatmanii]MCP1558248.1 hypothetical protein [Methylorubrum extorquens]MDF9791864.1 hypothetical protein [Methylorubrum extorquens]